MVPRSCAHISSQRNVFHSKPILREDITLHKIARDHRPKTFHHSVLLESSRNSGRPTLCTSTISRTAVQQIATSIFTTTELATRFESSASSQQKSILHFHPKQKGQHTINRQTSVIPTRRWLARHGDDGLWRTDSQSSTR